jgi:hypothetical protein
MPPKTAACGAGEARNYLTKARKFVDAARLFADEAPDVAASNAVHAAITAADAICCATIGPALAGFRSRPGCRAARLDGS